MRGNAGRHTQVSPAPPTAPGFVDDLLVKIKMIPDTAPGGCAWVDAGCPANSSFQARKDRFARASHDLASELAGPQFQHLGPGSCFAFVCSRFAPWMALCRDGGNLNNAVAQVTTTRRITQSRRLSSLKSSGGISTRCRTTPLDLVGPLMLS